MGNMAYMQTKTCLMVGQLFKSNHGHTQLSLILLWVSIPKQTCCMSTCNECRQCRQHVLMHKYMHQTILLMVGIKAQYSYKMIVSLVLRRSIVWGT